MTIRKFTLLHAALAVVAGFGGLFVSEKVSFTTSGSLLSEAYAVIGRPLTPMSYAGVARRTTARAETYGAAAAAAAHPAYAAPVYGAPCVQVVNAYGRLETVCR